LTLQPARHLALSGKAVGECGAYFNGFPPIDNKDGRDAINQGLINKVIAPFFTELSMRKSEIISFNYE